MKRKILNVFLVVQNVRLRNNKYVSIPIADV